MQHLALSTEAIWLTPLLNRVLRQIAITAEFSEDCDFKWPEAYIQTKYLCVGNTSYRLSYSKSVENNIVIIHLLFTNKTFHLLLTTKTVYLFLTPKTFYLLLTTKMFYFSITTTATYARTPNA